MLSIGHLLWTYLDKLGYPVYLLDIVGICKLLGACVVLAPGFRV
jgi:hypothetical protein